MRQRGASGRAGLVQVYTGDGKGKTTAAIGTGIRALGHGWRVHMLQFLKGGDPLSPYGEILALARLPGFTVEQLGPPHFVHPGSASEEDRKAIRRGLERAREALSSGEYDLVILDEINVALQLGLAEVDEVLALLDGKAEGTEVILTGRGAPRELIERADLVSLVEAVKHPFERGIAARPGIDY
ncbi:MAG: Cob(I)yrinic acid a,c-diamide adenosyltransferase [Acetothermia bacterium 64_32]|nr:MAG: Cob(I)yrinic acid a,c-diamide adenosyltransferase [Acetothermia bacterium 64_32]HAF71085.1 cob(I)yrinic acid a,c-diamide adenosyltransferase [Candidatus Acetothermia bacterium]